MTYPLAGYASDVWLTATPSVSLGSPESCTDSGDHTTYTANTHQFWDWTATFTVQTSPDGTTWTTVTNYTVQWSAGRVVFNSALSSGTHVQILAGSYFTATQLDASHKWALSGKGNVAKTTSFQASGGWEQVTPTTRGGTVKIDTYRNDNRVFKEIGNLLGLALYVDKTNNKRWQCYVTPTQDDLAADAQNLETESVTLTIVRDIYYLTS